MTSLPATLAAGLALGGVLALAGSWSRGARATPLPHLGVGAVAALGAALAGRFAHLPWLLWILLVAGAGGLAGLGALRVEQRLTGSRLVLAADLAVLAGLSGAALLVEPRAALAPPTVLGGGWPAMTPVVAGPLLAVTGLAGAGALSRVPAHRLGLDLRWTSAGALCAVLAALATAPWSFGALAPPQPLAVALGAGAAALLGATPGRAGLAGLGLGVAATLLHGAGLPAAVTLAVLALLLAGVPPRAVTAESAP